MLTDPNKSVEVDHRSRRREECFLLSRTGKVDFADQAAETHSNY
jgi:hypothetical protein